jgi:hypothetical protein
MLLTRAAGELAEPEVLADDEIDFVAVEPISTDDGVVVGLVVAMGGRPERDAALSLVPMTARIAGLVGFQLLLHARAVPKVHRFNNRVAALAANVEHVLVACRERGQLVEGDELTIAARHACECARDVVDAGRALGDAVLQPMPLRARS